jgi:hypothetical protein
MGADTTVCRTCFIGLISVLALTSLSWAKSKPKPQKETLNFGGKKRTYYVFLRQDLPLPRRGSYCSTVPATTACLSSIPGRDSRRRKV